MWLCLQELVTFQATDSAGLPVYHTNVMMAIGTDFAVVCLESVADAKERQHLLSKLSQHHQVGSEVLNSHVRCLLCMLGDYIDTNATKCTRRFWMSDESTNNAHAQLSSALQ